MGHGHSRYRYGGYPQGGMPYSNFGRMPINHQMMPSIYQPGI